MLLRLRQCLTLLLLTTWSKCGTWRGDWECDYNIYEYIFYSSASEMMETAYPQYCWNVEGSLRRWNCLVVILQNISLTNQNGGKCGLDLKDTNLTKGTNLFDKWCILSNGSFEERQWKINNAWRIWPSP